MMKLLQGADFHDLVQSRMPRSSIVPCEKISAAVAFAFAAGREEVMCVHCKDMFDPMEVVLQNTSFKCKPCHSVEKSIRKKYKKQGQLEIWTEKPPAEKSLEIASNRSDCKAPGKKRSLCLQSRTSIEESHLDTNQKPYLNFRQFTAEVEKRWGYNENQAQALWDQKIQEQYPTSKDQANYPTLSYLEFHAIETSEGLKKNTAVFNRKVRHAKKKLRTNRATHMSAHKLAHTSRTHAEDEQQIAKTELKCDHDIDEAIDDNDEFLNLLSEALIPQAAPQATISSMTAKASENIGKVSPKSSSSKPRSKPPQQLPESFKQSRVLPVGKVVQHAGNIKPQRIPKVEKEQFKVKEEHSTKLSTSAKRTRLQNSSTLTGSNLYAYFHRA